MFFDLLAAGRLQGRRVRLADVNADLIGCYRALRDSVERVIVSLKTLEREHRADGDTRAVARELEAVRPHEPQRQHADGGRHDHHRDAGAEVSPS